MDDIIKLNSRGGVNNYLKKVKKLNGEESQTYLIKTDTPPLRMGYVDTKRKFVDPSGGPMIIEGSILEEADAVVKSIDFVSGHGCFITLE